MIYYYINFNRVPIDMGVSHLNIICLILLSSIFLSIVADSNLFSCSFEKDSCGMENQAVTRAHWQREYLVRGQRMGYAMVLKGNEAKNHVARLLTPLIPTRGAESGCIKFQYYIEGRTPASIAVIKQEYVTKYLFATARKTGNSWKTATIPTEFLGPEVMFYFEADTREQDYGSSLVAFTNLFISSEPCDTLQ